jgi:hypothetical protein
VAPLRLGGLRGKQSTPSVWLGGTGEPLRSASGSGKERGTRHGARDVFDICCYQILVVNEFNGCHIFYPAIISIAAPTTVLSLIYRVYEK